MYLEHVGGGGGGEVDGVRQVPLLVVLRHEAVDDDGLRGALLSDEEDGLVLLCDRGNEEVCAHVVDVWYEDGAVLGGGVGRVAVVSHQRAPVRPLA